MKYYLLLIIMYSSLGIYCQSNAELEQFLQSLKRKDRKAILVSKECLDAVKLAIHDYHIDERKYFSIGDLSDWEVVFGWHMSTTLNLDIESVGCVPLVSDECYDDYANYKLKKIYGKDIFDKLEIGTDSLFSIGKGIERAKFIGGKEKLDEYINSKKKSPPNIISNKVNENEPIYVNIRFDVSENGKINNPVIYFVGNTNNKKWYEQGAIRIINEMEDWTPAIRFGKKVSSREFITIKFGEDSIKRKR